MKKLSAILLFLAMVTSCSWLNREQQPPIHLATVEYTFDGHTVIVPVYKQYKYTVYPYGERFADSYYPQAKYDFKTYFEQVVDEYINGRLHRHRDTLNDFLARFTLELFSEDVFENDWAEDEYVACGFMVKSDTCFFKEGVPYNCEPCDSSEHYHYGIPLQLPDVEDYFICPDCQIIDKGCLTEDLNNSSATELVKHHAKLPEYELIRNQSWCIFFIPDDSRKLSVKFVFKGNSKSEPADNVVVSGIIDLYNTFHGQVLVQ